MKTSRLVLASFLLLFVAVSGAGCAVEIDDPAESDVLSATDDPRPYFEVFEGADGRYYFHLSAANHEIVLQSQSYSSRTAALGGVLSVRNNGVDHARYDVREAADGRFYFNLKAANGKVIGSSEMFASRWHAERSMKSTVSACQTYEVLWAGRTGARFEVSRGTDGRYYFQLTAKNGEGVLRSQGYSSEAAALNGTFSVADNGLDARNYDIRQSANGGFYFNLAAANGETIGTSEVYSSRYNAERARNGVIALLPDVQLL